VIELVNITAGYGSHAVLRNISLVIPDGVPVALLGANGAGKTTLLRVVSGLLSPERGRVLIDGEDVTGWRPHDRARRGLCHIPAGHAICRDLTVSENLRLQLPPGSKTDRLEPALRQFPRLAERGRQQAGTLSGGEQQMLAVARAYVAEPRFLLIDEVSTGLAPLVVDEIYGHLSRIAASGVGMLVVEQYVTKALALARLVYVLQHGQLRFAGEAAELANSALLTAYLGEGAS
jgi:branched-chain amino acid transport system ATP-binding protein